MSQPQSPFMTALIPMVEFIGNVMGPYCEVVLHDLSAPEGSIIAIANNISGRKVGAPLTPFALKLIQSNVYLHEKYVINYEGYTESEKPTRSATYFIKDARGGLIGLLCINIDINRFNCLRRDFDKLVCGFFDAEPPRPADRHLTPIAPVGMPPAPTKVCNVCFPGKTERNPNGAEKFFGAVDEMMQAMVAEVLGAYTVPADRLSPAERKEAIAVLRYNGFFNLRGAVEFLARQFQVSEGTVYRYLKSLPESGDIGARHGDAPVDTHREPR